MAEFLVEPAGKPKPLVVLPRGSHNRDGWTVQFYVELARGVAGCCFCDGPIPKETTRFVIKVRLQEPVVSRNGSQRFMQTYYAHSGCMGGLIGNEVKRDRHSCWDCGAPPPGRVNLQVGPSPSEYVQSFHPFSCFTTTRMATARLCGRCAKKPKWKQCEGCHMMFPHYMVAKIVDDLQARWNEAMNAQFADLDVDDNGALLFFPHEGDTYGCEWCVRRAGVRTEEQAEAERADYEALRRKIAQEGIFGEDD